MWNPISIVQFVKIHLKKNLNDNEKVLRVRIVQGQVATCPCSV